MPIIGVTDRHLAEDSDFPGGLSIACKVWRGMEKTSNAPGKDLKDKFRMEFLDDRWERKFLEHYKTLEPTSLNIYLPYKTTERVFETWFTAFSAQGFKHKCNGQAIVEKMVADPYQYRGGTKYNYTKRSVNEPCLRQGNPVCPECGKNGSGVFYFYIRELYSAGMGSTRGCRMAVHGANDVPEFTKQLALLERTYGSLSGSPVPYPQTFGFIPYVLTRVETGTTKPIVEKKTVDGKTVYNETGARTQDSYWGLSISLDPEWLERLQKFYQEQELMRLSQHPELARLYGIDPIAALPSSVSALPPSVQTCSPAKLDTAIETEIVEEAQNFTDRLKQLRAFTKHTDEQIRSLCVGFSPAKAIASYDHFLALQRAMLIDWATRYDVWKHDHHAENSFDKFLAEEFQEPLNVDALAIDAALIQRWSKKVSSKVDSAQAE